MISGGCWLLAATAPKIRIATDVVKTSTCFRISTSIEENTRRVRPFNLTRPVLILGPRNSFDRRRAGALFGRPPAMVFSIPWQSSAGLAKLNDGQQVEYSSRIAENGC